MTTKLKLTQPQLAVLCVLMLRGPQTIGEIKGRTGRLFEFQSLDEVIGTIEELNRRDDAPFVVKLPRIPGKDPRYMHTLCGDEFLQEKILEQAAPKSDKDKFATLESEVDLLKNEIAQLKQQFADFKKQFE